MEISPVEDKCFISEQKDEWKTRKTNSHARGKFYKEIAGQHQKNYSKIFTYLKCQICNGGVFMIFFFNVTANGMDEKIITY
jgi:hypothetical protein